MKKTMLKRVLSFTLCMLLVYGLGSLTAAAFDGWSEAYKDYVTNGKYKNSEMVNLGEGGLSSGVRFALHDLDNNGTPELLVDNNASNWSMWYSLVYIFSDGEVRYAGDGGSLAPIGSVSTNMNYPGGFSYNCWRGSGECVYCTLENNKVKSITVYTDNGGSPEPYSSEIKDSTLKAVFDNAKDLDYYEYNAISAMGWDAFCALYGYTADGAAAAAQAEGTTSADGFQLSAEQKSAMDSFLAGCYALNLFPGQEDVFDCEVISSPTVLEMLLANNAFENFYTEEVDNTWVKEKWQGKDPRGAFKDPFEKTNAEQVDWILKNRFNYTDGDILSMREIAENALQAFIAGRETEDEPFYESEGYYYHLYDGAAAGETDVRILNSEYTFRDNFVYVSYTVGEYENAAAATKKTTDFFAKLGYKNRDGQTYWSLYKNSRTKFWDTEESVTQAAAQSEPQTQTDVQNGGAFRIGNLELDLWTVLLIALALIVIVLFVVIIALAVKNSKRKQKRAQMPQPQPAVQQPAVRSVAMPTPQYEPEQPQPQEKPRPEPKFRYRCRETDRSGKCEMCGTDVGMLMRIDAIKGEKINSRFFCRNCAAKIMRQVERDKNT